MFNVSTVVRNKVTKTVPDEQLVRTTQQQENPALRKSTPSPPPPLTQSSDLSVVWWIEVYGIHAGTLLEKSAKAAVTTRLVSSLPPGPFTVKYYPTRELVYSKPTTS